MKQFWLLILLALGYLLPSGCDKNDMDDYPRMIVGRWNLEKTTYADKKSDENDESDNSFERETDPEYPEIYTFTQDGMYYDEYHNRSLHYEITGKYLVLLGSYKYVSTIHTLNRRELVLISETPEYIVTEFCQRIP